MEIYIEVIPRAQEFPTSALAKPRIRTDVRVDADETNQRRCRRSIEFLSRVAWYYEWARWFKRRREKIARDEFHS